MMSAVRGDGNKAEALLRRELWRRGLRYRLQAKSLIGRPDIVFPRARVAVFVDGDFWHGRGLLENGEDAFRATMRTDRREWWITKLRRNIVRDETVTRTLADNGWYVVRVWESQVKSDSIRIADRLERMIRSRLENR